MNDAATRIRSVAAGIAGMLDEARPKPGVDPDVWRNNYVFSATGDAAASFPASPVYGDDMDLGHVKEGDAVALADDPDTEIGHVAGDGIVDVLRTGPEGALAYGDARWLIKVDVDADAADGLRARGLELARGSGPGSFVYATAPANLVPAPEGGIDAGIDADDAGNDMNSMGASSAPGTEGANPMSKGITINEFIQHAAARGLFESDGNYASLKTTIRISKIRRSVSGGRVARADTDMNKARDNVIRALGNWIAEGLDKISAGGQVHGLRGFKQAGHSASFKHGAESTGALVASFDHGIDDIRLSARPSQIAEVVAEIGKRLDAYVSHCIENRASEIEGVAALTARYPDTVTEVVAGSASEGAGVTEGDEGDELGGTVQVRIDTDVRDIQLTDSGNFKKVLTELCKRLAWNIDDFWLNWIPHVDGIEDVADYSSATCKVVSSNAKARTAKFRIESTASSIKMEHMADFGAVVDNSLIPLLNKCIYNGVFMNQLEHVDGLYDATSNWDDSVVTVSLVDDAGSRETWAGPTANESLTRGDIGRLMELVR